MPIIYGTEHYHSAGKPLYLGLGNFDGVHLGHRALLSKLISDANENNALSCVLLFNPHPHDYFFPEQKLHLITSIEERISLLNKLGIHTVIIEPFNSQIAGLSPEEFVERILINRLKISGVYAGFNYSFGSDAAGNTESLKEFGKQYGFNVHITERVDFSGETVSSTRIRSLLEHNDRQTAFFCMGQSVHP